MILNRFDLQTAAAVGKRRSYYADYHKRAGSAYYPFHCHDDGSVRSCATVSESRCTVRAGEFPGHGHFHGQHMILLYGASATYHSVDLTGKSLTSSGSWII